MQSIPPLPGPISLEEAVAMERAWIYEEETLNGIRDTFRSALRDLLPDVIASKMNPQVTNDCVIGMSRVNQVIADMPPEQQPAAWNAALCHLAFSLRDIATVLMREAEAASPPVRM